MSPQSLTFSKFTIFQPAASSYNWPLPASGATVKIFRRGTTVTTAVEVHEQDTVAVAVQGVGRLQVGDNVSGMAGSDRDFQVRSIGTNSLQLDYLGTEDITLQVGERIRLSQPIEVFADAAGQTTPLTSLTADSTGSVAFYSSESIFEYEVSGSAAGTAAGLYLEKFGGGSSELTWLNARSYPSIQAAIDALPPWGGTVFLPAGLWELTETIYTPCDRPCHLLGEGRHDNPTFGTVLQWSANVGMLRVRGDYSSVRGMTLRNVNGGSASREDQGYGIAIGRRNVVDPHPYPEAVGSEALLENARGRHTPAHSILIEDVAIDSSPGWGILISGLGKLSDETTDEYDALQPSLTEGGTLSYWIDLKRVRVSQAHRYGACFVGTGCTTVFFENCAFLGQGSGQVPYDTYYVYLGGCAQPIFTRCTLEGLSPATKAWARLFNTEEPIFDCCWFENDTPAVATPPTYFIDIAGSGRGGAIRHCNFIRGGNTRGPDECCSDCRRRYAWASHLESRWGLRNCRLE